MKRLGLVLIVALALGAVAHAEETVDRIKEPTDKQRAAVWPKREDGKPLVGAVGIDCRISTKGRLEDCAVATETPQGKGLAAAALALAPLFQVRANAGTVMTADGKTRIELDYKFDTPPNWLRKPSFDQLAAVFPVAAKGEGGRARIKCIVKTNGLLRACKVVSESRPGAGFGNAALLLAPSLLMKPAMLDGLPVESDVSIPIDFGDGMTFSIPTSGNISLLNDPVWDKTPSMPEILTELDKKVGDRFADGKVVFQCTVKKTTGSLGNCIILNTSPGMVQFVDAARSLTSKFTANVKSMDGIKNEARVNLAFAFPDMQSAAWSKRYLAHPKWIRTIDSDSNQPVFPDAAAKAGLKTGAATVDCVLSSTGALTNCSTVSESNPGVDFGIMAQRIAEVFVADPWTEDGLPADGAHVLVPIRMNYAPLTDKADAAAAAPAPTPPTKP